MAHGDKKRSGSFVTESKTAVDTEDQHEQTSSTTLNKFDEVQPYLQCIESIIYEFVGDFKGRFPHAWKEACISEISYWTLCDILSVQEAVTLLLNYYRYVMEEYFFLCRKNNITCTKRNKIQAGIYKMINNLECAVWNNEWYQLHLPISCMWLQNRKTSMEMCSNKTNYGNVENKNITTKHAAGKCNSSSDSNDVVDVINSIAGEHLNKNKNFDPTKNTNINALQMSRNPDHSHFGNTVLSESIDQDAENALLDYINQNGDAICDGTLDDDDIKDALQILVGDDSEIIDCNPDEDSEKFIPVTNNMQSTVRISDNIPIEQSNEQTQIHIFGDMVRRKCHEVASDLSLNEQEIVKGTITHFHELVTTQSMCAAQAYEQFEHILHVLIANTGKQHHSI